MSVATYYDILTREMHDLGFQVAEAGEEFPRLVVSSVAGEKCGKSHWALTAPGPVAVLKIDTGVDSLVRRFARNKVVIPIAIKSAQRLLEEGGKDKAYEREWKKAKDAIYRVIDNRKVRTLIGDTWTEMWGLCRLAEFGKLSQVMPHHYSTVNQEFRELTKAIFDRENLNAVLIHKTKKEYRENRKGDSNWTGNYERDGMGDIPFIADVNLEHYRQGNPDGEAGCTFGIRVIDSRYNAEQVIGMELSGEECNFQYLGLMCFPDSGPGDWE